MPTKKSSRDQAAMSRLFEDHSYKGGRLPELLDPVVEPEPPPLHILPTPELIPREIDEERPKRKARSEKVTGLHVILHAIQQNGFPHPQERGSFLMLPKAFKALLSLEPVAVIQVVYEIFDQTIGWHDPEGEHGRREWARLSVRHFELACGMTDKQVRRGLKRALQQGYILRRPRLDSFEYGIRWATQDSLRDRGLKEGGL